MHGSACASLMATQLSLMWAWSDESCLADGRRHSPLGGLSLPTPYDALLVCGSGCVSTYSNKHAGFSSLALALSLVSHSLLLLFSRTPLTRQADPPYPAGGPCPYPAGGPCPYPAGGSRWPADNPYLHDLPPGRRIPLDAPKLLRRRTLRTPEAGPPYSGGGPYPLLLERRVLLILTGRPPTGGDLTFS